MEHFDIAADLDTPVSAFLKIEKFEPHFLLESVEGGEALGRYSFIGFGEAVRFRVTGGETRMGDRVFSTPTTSEGLLEAFRKALELAPRPGPNIPELPFSGGLIGVAAFELAGTMLNLPAPIADDQPLADYVAPKSVLVFDHVTHRVALLHDGPEEERLELRGQIIEALRGPIPVSDRSGSYDDATPSIERQDFMELVEQAQDRIRAGDVYQLVLSIAFEGKHDLEPFQVYRALRILNPSPYMYFYRSGDLAVAGSSPEALVKMTGKKATLRPIAGTRPRGASREEDAALETELLEDPKEAAEHVMLVDLARNDLGRVSIPGSIKVEPYRSIERYSHVMHLVSGVEGVLRSPADAFDLFKSAFPAGTVSGAPKVKAATLISEMEPRTRGFYAGTVGYFGHDAHMDQALTIRTIIFEGDKYRYQAGAGIVFDSKPDAEHDEVLAKSDVLRAALAMARGGLQ